LLAIAEAHARIPARQVLRDAEVVNVLRLCVEARGDSGQRLDALGVEARVVGEEAGFVEAHERERRRDIDFPTRDLAVAGVLVGVLERARHAGGNARVHQRDQVADIAVEVVEANDAALTEAMLVADVVTPGGFLLEVRVAERLVIILRRIRVGERHELIERRAPHRACIADAELPVLPWRPLGVEGWVDLVARIAATGAADDASFGFGAFRANAELYG